MQKSNSRTKRLLPVSVCMIVRNEASRLPEMLSQLLEHELRFEEVIVVDTGSCDGTIDVCRSFGCQVHRSARKGFSEMRRFAFSLASSPWILWLDADEIVKPSLRRSVAALFEQDDAMLCDGYEINRMSRVEGKWIRHGDWYPDWNLRLFRSDRWSMDDRLVHESVKVPGRVDRLDGLIEHLTFKDWDDHRRRSNWYATLWAAQERSRGRRTGPGLPELRAGLRLVRGLIIKRGFLDGRLGFRLAYEIAREVRLKHTLLRTVDPDKVIARTLQSST